MGSFCDITFYTIPSFQMDSNFWKRILEELDKIGCSYLNPGERKSDPPRYWSDTKSDWFEYEDINYVIDTLCKEGGGGIHLGIGRVGITLSIRPNPIENVSISVNRTYFNREKGDKIWYDSGDKYYYLWDGPTGKEFSLQFLEIGKKIYEVINPFYGKGDIPENFQLYLSYKEVKSESIKAIYWANFFSPKLVKKFGREKLLSAPSWKTEELQDGGIMLVRSPSPFTIDEPYVPAEEVEKYLGIR